MSQQQSGALAGTTAPTESLTDEAVADYLRSHPDFFERNPALLLTLRLPHRTGGTAVSLVERQVSMLRQRNAQLERQFKDLVEVAKSNDVLVEKIHQLGLKLFRARGAARRLECLDTSLRDDFGAERAVLVLFKESTPEDAVRNGFVLRVMPDDELVRPFSTFLRAPRPRCGPLRDRQKAIFDRDPESVSSAALVPIGDNARVGFLVIGSRDPDYFHPGKRMDFLGRLGDLIAVALQPETAEERGA